MYERGDFVRSTFNVDLTAREIDATDHNKLWMLSGELVPKRRLQLARATLVLRQRHASAGRLSDSTRVALPLGEVAALPTARGKEEATQTFRPAAWLVSADLSVSR